MKKTLSPSWGLGVSQSHPLEKKYKKPLDKPHGMWYNKDVKGRDPVEPSQGGYPVG